MGRQGFRNKLSKLHRRQNRQRRQGRTEIMRRQTKLAGMRRQAILMARRMLDGMCPRRQLGEEEHSDEKEVAQLKHPFSLSGEHGVPAAKPLAQSA